MNLLFFFFKNEDGKEGEREREREKHLNVRFVLIES
jgi:hypothetical protein